MTHAKINAAGIWRMPNMGELIDRNRELANLHIAAASRYMNAMLALVEKDNEE